MAFYDSEFSVCEVAGMQIYYTCAANLSNIMNKPGLSNKFQKLPFIENYVIYGWKAWNTYEKFRFYIDKMGNADECDVADHGKVDGRGDLAMDEQSLQKADAIVRSGEALRNQNKIIDYKVIDAEAFVFVRK